MSRDGVAEVHDSARKGRVLGPQEERRGGHDEVVQQERRRRRAGRDGVPVGDAELRLLHEGDEVAVRHGLAPQAGEPFQNLRVGLFEQVAPVSEVAVARVGEERDADFLLDPGREELEGRVDLPARDAEEGVGREGRAGRVGEMDRSGAEVRQVGNVDADGPVADVFENVGVVVEDAEAAAGKHRLGPGLKFCRLGMAVEIYACADVGAEDEPKEVYEQAADKRGVKKVPDGGISAVFTPYAGAKPSHEPNILEKQLDF